MRFLRSLAVFPLFIVLALVAAGQLRAQTNDAGAATFPDLQRLQQDLRQEQQNPTSAPPSQGPFGEQAPLPTPAEHPNPPANSPSPWLITPTVQLSETATDNAGFTHSGRQADLKTFSIRASR